MYIPAGRSFCSVMHTGQSTGKRCSSIFEEICPRTQSLHIGCLQPRSTLLSTGSSSMHIAQENLCEAEVVEVEAMCEVEAVCEVAAVDDSEAAKASSSCVSSIDCSNSSSSSLSAKASSVFHPFTERMLSDVEGIDAVCLHCDCGQDFCPWKRRVSHDDPTI